MGLIVNTTKNIGKDVTGIELKKIDSIIPTPDFTCLE